jgi:hypothetical protein
MASRPRASARELLLALIDGADLETAYPFGGGVLRVQCSGQLLEALCLFDDDEREDDEREAVR